MQARRHYEDWVDRDSVTQIYVRRAPSTPPLLFVPRHTPPNQPAVAATGTMAVRPAHDPWIGIGFLVACILIGIVIGTVLSLRGGKTVAAKPAPAAVVAPKVTVIPIEPEETKSR
jgi:hypothetical protein